MVGQQSNLIYIKTKNYAMELIKKYQLLNVLPADKDIGRLLYVFERSDELVADLDRLSKEYQARRGKAYYLNDSEAIMVRDLIKGSKKIDKLTKESLLHKFENIKAEVDEEQADKLKKIINSGKEE